MTTQAGAVAQRYHRAWTSGDFDMAQDLLSGDLKVEVPINAYATKEAFVEALETFGSQARSVDLVSMLASDTEAMLLYDMDVRGLGDLRVVEHFSVVDGRIARLRQVHDTAALRAGEFDRSTHAARAKDADYESSVEVASPPGAVYQALTTRDGIAAWWTSMVDGTCEVGATLRLAFVGLTEEIVLSIEGLVPDWLVVWRCQQHTGHPEWVGTLMIFAITSTVDGSCLRVLHAGLTPILSCYETCVRGWDHFLSSIQRYVDTGTGLPFDNR